MPAMEATESILALTLPPLLLLSAFFSASETALFGLTQHDRMAMRRSHSIAARAVASLLAQPRMLLITILLGNITANTLYFVVSSVLLMQIEVHMWQGAAIAATTLLAIVLVGEMLPKTLANTRRITTVSMIAPPLLALHRVIGPIRAALDGYVVAPLSRLTAPKIVPARLSVEELEALFDAANREGLIDAHEQAILEDVINLSRLKVRDVMTPRVRMIGVRRTATRQHVADIARRTRLTRLPVYEGSLDHIVGVLNVKSFLSQPASHVAAAPTAAIEPPEFVPEMATLDQLMDRFRRTGTAQAIVVDEYGGTSGIVAIEDVVGQMLSDVTSLADLQAQRARMIGLNQWRVGGDVSVHDWADAFGQRLVSPRASTLGGLIFDRLGRVPQVGDSVTLGNVRLAVEQVERSRIVSVIVTLLGGADEPSREDSL